MTSPSIDYIQGYLLAIVSMMECESPCCTHVYYFERLEYSAADLTMTVRARFRDHLERFQNKQRPVTDANRQSIETLTLTRFDDWQWKLAIRLQEWLGGPFLKKYKCSQPNTWFADGFVTLLREAFDNTAICWTVDGDARIALGTCGWGGCMFDDFFFETAGGIYHLHFEWDD